MSQDQSLAADHHQGPDARKAVLGGCLPPVLGKVADPQAEISPNHTVQVSRTTSQHFVDVVAFSNNSQHSRSLDELRAGTDYSEKFYLQAYLL